MHLAERLKRRIRADGPMVFEQFMAACLYDANGGFFSTGPLRSTKSGDFLTSPEVVRQFVTSSGGTTDNLKALSETIPKKCEDLFLRRCAQCSKTSEE